MFDVIGSALQELLGDANGALDVWQMALRGLIIYLTAIILVKVGEKRFMGKNTGFDMILGIILGSVLSRAITGNAPFLPTVGAGVVLVALHWLFSFLSFHFDGFGALFKGNERVLVRDGEIDWDSMRKSHISRKDLESALYSNGQVTDLARVRLARLERSGDISVITQDSQREPRIVEVSVEHGVQRVRIELT